MRRSQAAHGVMMMLGACVGFWGLQDQMTHFVIELGEVGWEDSGAVDIDPMRNTTRMWEVEFLSAEGWCGSFGFR